VKFKSKIVYSLIAILVVLSSLYVYPFFSSQPAPQDLVKQQLVESALSPMSVWNQQYLDRNSFIKDKVDKFEKGTLCNSLKKLDTKTLTHAQIKTQLKDLGYVCLVRPMSVNPRAPILKYLKIDKTTTENPEEPGVVQQEICYERTQPDCVIRMKRDGFPLNRRSSPHSSKAVLLDEHGDPGSFDNEAFKVGVEGQAIPKGPKGAFGLQKCPYKRNSGKKDKDSCAQWVDLIMEQAHPLLREPIGTSKLNPR